MRVAGSSDGKTIGAIKVAETPAADFEEGMRVFESLAREIAGEESVEAIVGGVAGPLSRDKSFLVNAPNIPGWIGKPLKETLEKKFKARVAIQNDTALVGLGEAVVGAGKGHGIVAYVGVGTGVGGVRLVHGVIDENVYGFEPGHHIIDMNGNKSFESLAAGKALKNRTGKNPHELDQKDPVWKELANVVAVGLHNVAVFWSPDVIVLGGSMVVGDPAIPMAEVIKRFKEIMHIFPEIPFIEKADLGDEGGLHGGLVLLRGFLKS